MMDDTDLSPVVMHQALGELDIINRWLGGHATSLSLLRHRLRRATGTVRVLDVGAGGAGTARSLSAWAERHGVDMRTTLLDIHPSVCTLTAKAIESDPQIQLLRADAFQLPFADDAFDFVHTALFLHHFRDESILHLLAEMRRVAAEGVVVNDLERHSIAFYSIRFLTRFVGRSEVVRNDAPLSVRRGFRAEDLERWRTGALAALGYRRRWAFRWAAWIFADNGTPRGPARRV